MVLTPDQWVERAENARMTAKLVSDRESRQLLLKVAEIYEKVAIRARLIANEKK